MAHQRRPINQFMAVSAVVPPGRNRRAFTLVEILVVIAIIGILAALVMPVAQRGIAAAQKASCLSNLRQLGSATLSYAGDNNLTLPYGYWVGTNGGGVSWDDLISPYLGITLTQAQLNSGSMPGNIRVLQCPSDKLPPLSSVSRRSYAIPRGDYTNGVSMGVGRTLNVSAIPPDGVRLLNIPKPSQTILLTDFSSALCKGDSSDNMAGNAGGSVVNNPTLQLTSGNGKTLHGGSFNYLFVDGHAETLNPLQTVGSGTLDHARGMWTIDPND